MYIIFVLPFVESSLSSKGIGALKFISEKTHVMLILMQMREMPTLFLLTSQQR